MTNGDNKVIVFEWFVATSVNDDPDDDSIEATLIRQAVSMLVAVALDFLQTDRQVTIPVGAKIADRIRAKLPRSKRIEIISIDGNLRTAMEDQINRHDAIWLIAPETDHILEDWTRWAESTGLTVLSCPADHVALFSSKSTTCHWLQERGIRTPSGIGIWLSNAIESALLQASASGLLDFCRSVVVKPDDGVGGEKARRVSGLAATIDYLSKVRSECRRADSAGGFWRVEQFHAGIPVSCGILFDDTGWHLLPATRQVLEPADVGVYRNSQSIENSHWQARAQRMASVVAERLRPATGYYGVDMILANREDEDCVIEINPRTSASYALVRHSMHCRLARLSRGFEQPSS